jgi:hypothetical membrane protein
MFARKTTMQKKSGLFLLAGAYLLMLLEMIILPFFSVPEYFSAMNTMEDLGSQSAPHAWIMNFTFISLAIGSAIAGWSFYEGHVFHRSILVFSGISRVLAALFNHAPLNPLISYNITEAGLHQYFSCTAVFAFVILSLATSLILEREFNKLLAGVAGLSAMILLVLTSESDHLAGIWNRLLLVISFGWMIYCFKTTEY